MGKRGYSLSVGSLQRGEIFAGQRFARHFDVAAKGNGGDAVIGFAVLDAEKTRRETDRELLYADAKELGREKMAKLMDENHDAEHDKDGDDRNQNSVHRTRVRSTS